MIPGALASPDRIVGIDLGTTHTVVAHGRLTGPAAAEVLSAPNVAAHYGANVRVVEDDAGVFVLPVRTR